MSTESDIPMVSQYRDDASMIAPLFIDPDSPHFSDQVRKVVLEICPSVAKEMKVQALSGGLSNELFIVTSLSTKSSVLVRVHPPENHTVGDRETENRLVAWLSRCRMAPIFHGRFQNGRIEEFYESVTPLSSQEMKDYAPKIARILADFHRLDIPDAILPNLDSEIPSWFSTVDQWVASIQSSQDIANKALFDHIATEWEWLRPQLLIGEPTTEDLDDERKALQWIREIVLTHMDGQSFNILKQMGASHGEGQVRLIDFEYAGRNPRAADLANTFCEFCNMNNLKADFEREYPSIELQNEFLIAYLDKTRFEQPSTSVLKVMRQEIGRFTLLSHLGWAAWGGIMGGSMIEFDYIQYSQHRMDGYSYHKSRFFG